MPDQNRITQPYRIILADGYYAVLQCRDKNHAFTRGIQLAINRSSHIASVETVN